MRKTLLALPMIALLGASALLLASEGDLTAGAEVPTIPRTSETARAELAPVGESDVPAWIETKKAAKPKPKKSVLKP